MLDSNAVLVTACVTFAIGTVKVKVTTSVNVKFWTSVDVKLKTSVEFDPGKVVKVAFGGPVVEVKLKTSVEDVLNTGKPVEVAFGAPLVDVKLNVSVDVKLTCFELVVMVAFGLPELDMNWDDTDAAAVIEK